jgi:hypothetical protein
MVRFGTTLPSWTTRSRVADLLSSWDCLRTQVGRFARRDSCGGDPTHTLDVRLSLGFVRLGGHTVNRVVEGLNLLDPEPAEVDRALHLVDNGGTLACDPATGNVVVPLVANPQLWAAGDSLVDGPIVSLWCECGALMRRLVPGG